MAAANLRLDHLLARLRKAIGRAVPEIAARIHEIMPARKRPFLQPIVEVRRETHAGFRTKVPQDFPREEFAADFVGMRAIDGNRAGAFRGIFRSVDAPASRLSAFEQARGHAHGFSAYRFDAHGIEDVQPRLARIQRWNMRRAVEVAERILTRIDRAGFEAEWTPMRNPSCERGTQLGAQIFAHIEITHARAAAQPLEYAADREVGAQCPNVDRNRAGSLEDIEDYMSADAVRALDNRPRVDDVGTAEQNM